MTKVYLFDWGDTLMVDFPAATGKMCDWENVAAVDGAQELLAHLSQDSKLYLATGAADSTESDIIRAFARVNLNQYISGYFCQHNLGVAKGHPEFFQRILQQLNQSPADVTMVGNSLARDIKPAHSAGIQAIWLAPDGGMTELANIKIIRSLRELMGC